MVIHRMYNETVFGKIRCKVVLMQGGSDAEFDFCSEFGVRFIYQISQKNEHIHLMAGAAYMNAYSNESFFGGNDFSTIK